MNTRPKTDSKFNDALPAAFGGTPIRSPEKPLVFGAPVIGEAEIRAVSDCLRSRWIGMGPQVSRFEEEFARYKSVPHAVAVSSGTAALHLALIALDLGAGDEVIVPSMTFCSTVNAIIHAGATPVLADCDRETFNLSAAELPRLLTSRTRAILVVHMCGACAEMDAILAIARKHSLMVIEDCAHAIEADYRGEAAGTMGDVGCFSFYATKNVTTGDGGMVITRNSQLAARIKRLSIHGMSATAWSRVNGGPRFYEIVDLGFKCNMTDIEASLGLVQLSEVEQRHAARRRIWNLYREGLKGLPLTLPPEAPRASRHACHLFAVLLDLDALRASRDEIIIALQAEHIGAGVHYVPVHMQPYYKNKFGLASDDFKNSRFIGQRTLSLPLSADLSVEDVEGVCRAMRRILKFYQRSSQEQRVETFPRIEGCSHSRELSLTEASTGSIPCSITTSE